MTRLFAALALILTAFAAKAEDVTTYTLDNGMEVVVIEDNRAPVVVHMVWYKVGSADEPVGASGVAHFLEHLLFKATDVLESGEFSATVAAAVRGIKTDRMGNLIGYELVDRVAILKALTELLSGAIAEALPQPQSDAAPLTAADIIAELESIRLTDGTDYKALDAATQT